MRTPKYWLISDTHFNHRKLEEYSGRPAQFEDLIVKNTLSVVREGDTLIHLGDFCIGEDMKWHEEYVKKIPARRILVRGNHDRKSNAWYLDHGWDFVCDDFSLEYGGYKILFSHEPRAKFHRHNLNVHGHLHNNDHRLEDLETPYDTTFHRLFALEYTNYAPVELTEFLSPAGKKIKKK